MLPPLGDVDPADDPSLLPGGESVEFPTPVGMFSKP
jgi:hypothetical protein